MPVTIKINISGDKELLAKLRAADKIIRARVLTEGMSDATRYVAKNAAEYPAETEANAPPPPYYIRGTGTQYATYNRQESERLNLHWVPSVNVKVREGGIGTVRGVVENRVSYAPWVHSVVRQSLFHKIRNWRNIERIKQDVEQGVVKIFRDGVEKALRVFGI